MIPHELAGAAPVSKGMLKSGKAVQADVATADGIQYTWTAVAGHHVTFAITKPEVPSGGNFEIQAYSPSGDLLSDGVYFTTGDPTDYNFTPTVSGTSTVVIDGETGSFTLTFAKDLGGGLKSGTSKNVHIKYEGQDAVYTWTAVAGHHVTFAITKPEVPSGGNYEIQAYSPSGSLLSDGVYFTTGDPTDYNFTPTASGTCTVVITGGSIGTFTLTYAKDVTGTLVSGKPVNTIISHEGQDAVYTWTAVDGHHVTFAITKPEVPSGGNYEIQAYSPSGSLLSDGVYFTTGDPTDYNFTPTASGTCTVVITGGSIGTFTLTYTAG